MRDTPRPRLGRRMLRTYRRPLVLVVVAYLVLALLGRATPRGEIFPFFSWDLFSTVPAVQQIRPAIRVLSVDGEALGEPVALPGSRYARGQQITISRIAGDLVEALSGIPDDVPRLRAALEDNHLVDAPMVYAVVLEHFDPLARFASGDVTVTEVARFGHGGADARAGFDLRDGVLVTPAGTIAVQQGPVGFVESISTPGRWVRLTGWAGDRVRGDLPDRLVVVADGEVVHLGGVSVPRAGVAEDTGHPTLRRAGFSLHVPAARVEDPGTLTVVAVFGDDRAVTVPRIVGDGR